LRTKQTWCRREHKARRGGKWRRTVGKKEGTDFRIDRLVHIYYMGIIDIIMYRYGCIIYINIYAYICILCVHVRNVTMHIYLYTCMHICIFKF
jgi:hypothetical protein